MSETATERVRAAIAAKQPATLRDWSHALREAFGLSKRQAEKIAPHLLSAGLAEDEQPAMDDVLIRLQAVERALHIGGS